MNTPSLKNVFPQPQKAVERSGTFALPSVPNWRTEENSFEETVRFFAKRIGFSETPDSGNPHLVVQKEILPCPEAYKLRISPNGITIAASQKTGIFRALTTLSQLMEGEPSPGSLPCIEVE
ncbi:MAG: glycoside hydrolase family 20 zincin-like fold domain-containing protein, partial [Opitutae bacterium]